MDSSEKDESYGDTIFWRIENFNSKPSFNFIKSQVFKIQSTYSTWQMEIADEGNYLAAYLYKVANSFPYFANCSLSILTGSGWTTAFKRENEIFYAGGRGFRGSILYLAGLTRDEFFYLPNGSLTICFRLWHCCRTVPCQRVMISRLGDGDHLHHRQIQTFSSLKLSDMLSFPISYNFQSNSLPSFDDGGAKKFETQETQTSPVFIYKDLHECRKMLKSIDILNVTLRTATEEFSVDKAQLCAKSPVFKAMFETKMKENASKMVDIGDIDDEAMELFVDFVHTGHLYYLNWSVAVSLYYVADKYQIDSLKEQSVPLLAKNISNDNICELLALADLHEDDELMDYAEEYFCQHSKAILPSTQWKVLLFNTELVAKLLCKLAETM